MSIARYLTTLIAASASCLQVCAALDCSIAIQGNEVVISWLSESGRTYTLQHGDTPEGSWRVVSVQTAAAQSLSVTVPVEHKAAFFRLGEAPPPPDAARLVWIPPGTFTMGSPEDDVDRNSWEGPPTEVIISRGFWMGKYEVTQGEYLEVMGVNPSFFSGVRDWPHPGTDHGNDLTRPVENVTWAEAVAYCVALTERERAAGRIAPSSGYRLPTEAEWEYACRAGTSTRFSYGNDPGYGSLTEYAWYDDNSGWQTHPVGQKKPNAWGLFDMHGNVWERCHDWFAYELPGGIVVDPRGPPSGDHRVIRGGSYYDYGSDCRSTCRRVNHPGIGHANCGFRVVLTPGQP